MMLDGSPVPDGAVPQLDGSVLLPDGGTIKAGEVVMPDGVVLSDALNVSSTAPDPDLASVSVPDGTLRSQIEILSMPGASLPSTDSIPLTQQPLEESQSSDAGPTPKSGQALSDTSAPLPAADDVTATYGSTAIDAAADTPVSYNIPESSGTLSAATDAMEAPKSTSPSFELPSFLSPSEGSSQEKTVTGVLPSKPRVKN